MPKILSSSRMQIHKELEEASRVCGRGTQQTILRIALPVVRPDVVAGMTQIFILAIREPGLSSLLSRTVSGVVARS
ncbi:hypothetical protein STAQ_21390 [Allostella sp. ATCC 35155]|nr:hypothetical protein STAQ_21390 [Stella sp. ATCC 35155]